MLCPGVRHGQCAAQVLTHCALAGLAVHWILFGSSGHISRPWSGVLPNFYKSLPLMHSQHTLVKTIANTR